MNYDIYGKLRKTIYEFRGFDYSKDDPYLFSIYSLRSERGFKVRSHHEYETILLENECTDWVYEEGDHITFEGKEYKVTRVAKTLNEDHAKVYIDYVKYLEDDEESKAKAEADKAIYEQGEKDGIAQALGKVVPFDEVCIPPRKSWIRRVLTP